ncbi:hypothetical protein [Sphingobium fuliginis]|uniref:Uncharacterized protein n=1 Tax=Sphingobium fuliginis ATCC 27551 TaxID=1208342 RepID=A0A5B8CFX2_SPHSA|nr:hypothetical protein [Sphingobium fuliginis]QDC38263.1 hypothetical protein FIL70_14565 [Sphingobium fuliginis ATCC 27551]
MVEIDGVRIMPRRTLFPLPMAVTPVWCRTSLGRRRARCANRTWVGYAIAAADVQAAEFRNDKDCVRFAREVA